MPLPTIKRLSGVSEAIFGSYLIKEHPQTATLILSRVTPVCAAKVMAQLPRERLNALGKAALEYQRNEFDRDQWMDRLESWLRELSDLP